MMKTERRRNTRLLLAMDAARMNGTEVARRAGMSRATVSMILRRRIDSTAETWRRIAEVLGVRVDAIREEAVR